MRYLTFFIAVVLVSLDANAQQYQFVYVQTDNKQPFYIRVNEQLYSSSTTGYVVVPKLQSGNYSMSIGFPKNEWPAQQINVKVADKDLGFVLKNFDSKGWGLFNLQTMEVLQATTIPAVTANETSTAGSGNMFSEVLADVVNTPSIKTPAPEVKKPEFSEAPKIEPNKPKEIPVAAEKPAQEVVKSPESTVKKISTLKDAEGTVVTYVAEGPFSKDTVRIMLSAETPDIEAEKEVDEAKSAIQVTPQATIASEEKPASATASKEPAAKNPGDPKFLEIELPNPNNTTANTTEKVSPTKNEVVQPVSSNKDKEEAAGLIMINSDCKKLANEEDFYKLRKNMSAERADDDMVNAARKMFRQKCYSTEQIKNLGLLFLNDEGKYKFFDAAYPYIYDSGNFPRLQSELKDEYYIKRFKAMIRK